MNRDVSFTLLTRGVQFVFGFAATVVSARFLGPTGRGQYFFVITLTLLVVQFANLGLQSSNTYRVARDQNLLQPLVANSLWTSVVLGVGASAAAVAILLATNWFPTTRPALMWFALVLAPPILFFTLGTNLLVGIDRIRTFNVFELVGNLVVMAALVCAGVLAPHVPTFLAASAAAWGVVSASLAAYLVRRSGNRLGFRTDVFRAGLRYSIKAYVIALFAFLVLRSNVFLLQRFAFEHELGYYSVAAQIADAMAILPASVALVLFPRLVRDDEGRWAATLRTIVVVGAVLLVVCAIAGLVAGPFVRFFFGQAFAPAAHILRWMLPGVLALGLTTVLSQFLAAVGMPKVTVAIWAVAVAVVLGVGRLLIAPYHAVGAAATLSITYGVLLVLVAGAAVHYSRAERRAARGPLTPHPSPEWAETPGA